MQPDHHAIWSCHATQDVLEIIIYLPVQESSRKKGIKNTKQASKKNTLPNIAQKLPQLAMIKPIAEMMKSIQPSKSICLLFKMFPYYKCQVVYV